jgi:transcription termination factor Rho
MPIYEPSPFASPASEAKISPDATSRARRAAGIPADEPSDRDESAPTPTKRRVTRRRATSEDENTPTDAAPKVRRPRKKAEASVAPAGNEAPTSTEEKPTRRRRTPKSAALANSPTDRPTPQPEAETSRPPSATAAPQEESPRPEHSEHRPSSDRPSQTEGSSNLAQDHAERPRPENREGREDRFSRRNRRRFRPRRRDRRDRGDRNFQGDRPPRPESDSFDGPDAAEFDNLPPDDGAPPVFQEGVLEVSGKGFGFLREAKAQFLHSKYDTFVTPEVIRRYSLRDGIFIKGQVRRGMRGPQLFKLTEIEGQDPESFGSLPVFEELTSINPIEWLRLETEPERYTTRVIDLMAPIGKGQRGLIVAPPRTGKTTLLQHIADSVVKNHPEMKLMILLVDERPEEVTEIRRTLPQAELFASSNDSELKSHTRIAQLAIERARRLVEMGRDVFLLMDSLTRVGRAFNNAQSSGGRTMSGGVDTRALEIPRRLFASARNTEEAGSLTIMATALIETGSRMDDLIFLEFKGTGNMELVLDRRISDQRIYPAVDIFQSGTRREELLLPADSLHKISVIRRGLAGHKPLEAMERLLFFLRKHPTNAEMLLGIPG